MKKFIVGALCCIVWAAVSNPGNAALLLHQSFDQVDGTGPFTTPDSSVPSNTGTLVNMDNTNLVPGKVGNALRFDGGSTAGTADRVEIPENDADFDRTYTEFTFAAWLKPTSAAFSAANAWIAGKMTTGSNRGWQVNINPTNQANNPGELTFTYFPSNLSGASQDVFLGPNANLAPDKWIHFAATFKGSDAVPGDDLVKLYVNGELIVSVPATFATLNGSNNRPLQIGNRGSSIANSWNGLIDEVYIFDEELSVREIAALVPEPNALVLTLFGLTLTMAVFEKRRSIRRWR
jgi:hypothetical protein